MVNGNGVLTNPGSLQIGGSSSAPGNLTVTGITQLNGGINGGLSVTGATSITGAFTVNTGVMPLKIKSGLVSPYASKIEFGDGMGWKTRFQMNDTSPILDLFDGGQIRAYNDLTVEKNLSVDKNLNVTGPSTLTGKIYTVNGIYGGGDAVGPLLPNGLTSTGPITTPSITVSGMTNLNYGLKTIGNVEFTNGDVFVRNLNFKIGPVNAENIIMNSTNGNINTNGTLTVGGALTVGGLINGGLFRKETTVTGTWEPNFSWGLNQTLSSPDIWTPPGKHAAYNIIGIRLSGVDSFAMSTLVSTQGTSSSFIIKDEHAEYGYSFTIKDYKLQLSGLATYSPGFGVPLLPTFDYKIIIQQIA